VIRLVVTGGSLTQRPKKSLCCLLDEALSQINEQVPSAVIISAWASTIFQHHTFNAATFYIGCLPTRPLLMPATFSTSH